MTPRITSKKSGPLFVVALIGLAVLAGFLTRWNYTKTNFSTSEAVIKSQGAQATEAWAQARFPKDQAAHIRPGMMSIVTIDDYAGKKIEAFVDTLTINENETALVSVRLPSAAADVFYPDGAKCEVTVDASVSPEMLKAKTIPRQ